MFLIFFWGSSTSYPGRKESQLSIGTSLASGREIFTRFESSVRNKVLKNNVFLPYWRKKKHGFLEKKQGFWYFSKCNRMRRTTLAGSKVSFMTSILIAFFLMYCLMSVDYCAENAVSNGFILYILEPLFENYSKLKTQ